MRSNLSAGERRQAWRFPANLELRFPSGRGVTHNLSASGVLFETTESFVAGARISFRVNLENLYTDLPVHLECQGRIARVEQHGGKMHVAATIESCSFDPSERPAGHLAVPWVRSGGATDDGERTRDRISAGDSPPSPDGLTATLPTDDSAPGWAGKAQARDNHRGSSPPGKRSSERRGIFSAWFGRSRERGLSTTEVIVNLAIIGILAGIAVEVAGNVLKIGRTRGAAHQVASAMRGARQYAISSFATYTVTLTGTTVTVTCTAACPPSAPNEAVEPILHGATTSTPTPPIAFGPLGTASSPGSVVVSYPGAPAWEVRVTAAGRVRVCSPSCS